MRTKLQYMQCNAIAKKWLSIFYCGPFVSRVKRRICIRIVRLWRSTYDVLIGHDLDYPYEPLLSPSIGRLRGSNYPCTTGAGCGRGSHGRACSCRGMHHGILVRSSTGVNLVFSLLADQGRQLLREGTNRTANRVRQLLFHSVSITRSALIAFPFPFICWSFDHGPGSPELI